MKKIIALGIIALSLAGTASAQVKPEEQIKYRQAGYSFMSWNMGKIKAQVVDAPQSFNKDQVLAAARLIAATAIAAYGGIALVQDQVFIARFCFILVGALFGFLWFNVHPAELFMGDTGSLPLGAVLAVVALMTGQWPMLLVIGIIPLAEMVSDVIQIVYFKWTKGKRFFKMAPIHLHFELLGWSETQVVQRFWLIGLMAALIGIGLSQV